MTQSKVLDKPFVNVFLFSFFWAIAIFYSKLGLNKGAAPMAFLVESSFVTLLVLTLYVWFRRREELLATSKRTLWILTGLNLLAAVGTILMNIGYTMTSAVNIGFLGKFTLVTTLVLATLILNEKMTLSKLTAAFVMLLGVYFMTTDGRGFIPKPGDIFILLACIGMSLNSVCIKKFFFGEKQLSGTIVSFVRVMLRTFFILFASMLIAQLFPSLRSVFAIGLLPSNMLGYVIIRGVVSAGSIVFLYRSLKVATASYTTMMSMMTPVMVSLGAVFFLGESVSVWQMIGGGLIIASSFITHYLKV